MEDLNYAVRLHKGGAMNAILKYPGGKWRIAEWILDHMPPHKVYLEPFFGSGAVLFCKRPASIETVNDINGDIVNLFRVCRDNPAELAALIELTPFSREEYIDCGERTDDPVEQARRTLVRYWQSYGTSNSSLRSWKNSQTVAGPNNASQWSQLPEIITRITARLKEVQIEHYDALELIKRYDNPDTLIYADPPYLQALRKRNIYKNEMSEADHIALLDTLLRSKSKVILSAYQSDLYDSALKGWYIADKTTQAQFGQPRTERLYMNYQPPALSLLDYDFAGGRL